MKVNKRITGILALVLAATTLTGCMSSAQLLEQQQNAPAATGAPVTAPPQTTPAPAEDKQTATPEDAPAESLAEGETAAPTTEGKSYKVGENEISANTKSKESLLISSVGGQLSKYKDLSWQEIPDVQRAELNSKLSGHGGLPDGAKAERAKDGNNFLEVYYVETNEKEILVYEKEKDKYCIFISPK